MPTVRTFRLALINALVSALLLSGCTVRMRAVSPLELARDPYALSLSLSTTGSQPLATATFPVTVVFSRPVTGFTAADVILTNASLGAVTGSGAHYSFWVTAAQMGAVTVNVAANSVHDEFGESNIPAATLSVYFGMQVEPVYGSHGVSWNDYVRNDGVDVYHASDDACDATESSQSACLHAGEMRKVVIHGPVSCAGLTLVDALGAFDWTCALEGGLPTFFSSELRSAKGLQDLLLGNGWAPNRVILSGGSGAESDPTVPWWNNPVAALPDNSAGSASVLSLDEVDDDGGGPDQAFAAGTIFTLASSRATQGYNLNLDRLAMVTLGGAVLSYGGQAANNCAEGSGEIAGADYRCVVSAGNQKFLWVEGEISGNQMAENGLYLRDTRFSRMHRLTLRRGITYGLWIGTTSNYNRISSLTATENDDGVNVGPFRGNYGGPGATGNLFVGVRTFRNSAVGMFLILSHKNRARDIRATENGDSGIFLWGAERNQMSNLQSSNNHNYGFSLYLAHDNHLSQLIGSHNLYIGLQLYQSDRNGISFATFANNGADGIHALEAPQTTLHHLVSVNNGHDGISIGALSNQGTFSQLVTSANDRLGLLTNAAEQNRYAGVYITGNNGGGECGTGGSAVNPGVNPGSCTVSGGEGSTDYAPGSLSNAIYRPGRAAAPSFRAKVIVDDSANGSDTSGAAAYPGSPGTFDWLNFESSLRVWGRDGSAFPHSDQRGEWASGAGRIWDWRVKLGDTVLRNKSRNGATANEPFVVGRPCPGSVHGNVAITHQFPSPQTYLQNAREPMGDGSGDDDGLCETGEVCVYAPHFGADQGEGAFTPSACLFQDDGGTTAVRQVTMYAHASEVRTFPFSDNFEATALDASLWSGTQSAALIFGSQANGVLTFVPPANQASQYDGVRSATQISVHDRSTVVELTGIVAGGDTTYAASLQFPSSRTFEIGYHAGSLFARRLDGASVSSYLDAPYDPILHRFLRIRHVSATDSVHFDTSADGVSWTLDFNSAPCGMSAAAVNLALEAGVDFAHGSPGQGSFAQIYVE